MTHPRAIEAIADEVDRSPHEANPDPERAIAEPEAPMVRIEWRVLYDEDSFNTFNTDPALDGARALEAFAEECAAGNSPRLLCRIDGGAWLPRHSDQAERDAKEPS